MEKWTDLFKWVVELSPSKAIIAVLLALSIYFGWNSFQTNKDYKILFDEKTRVDSLRVNDTKECNQRIAAEVKECKEQYNNYRNEKEADLRRLADANQKKLDDLYDKLIVIQNKAAVVENKSEAITKKIK